MLLATGDDQLSTTDGAVVILDGSHMAFMQIKGRSSTTCDIFTRHSSMSVVENLSSSRWIKWSRLLRDAESSMSLKTQSVIELVVQRVRFGVNTDILVCAMSTEWTASCQ